MNYLEIASDYRDAFDFNVIPLENKVPKFKWEGWQTQVIEVEKLSDLYWNERTNGIGAISGIHDLRCLDFDSVTDEKIIAEFVKRLGLPNEYIWIVKSGSGKGFHIWFYCDDDEYIKRELDGEKAYYKLALKENGACDHVELRWNRCQTVLPPSKHPSGKLYEFVNLRSSGLPSAKPQRIGVGKLVQVIKELCVVGTETKNVSAAEAKKELSKTNKPNYNKKSVKEAAEFLKEKINNYEDFLRIGFSLASLGEEGREYFLTIGLGNPNYPEDSQNTLNKKFDSFIEDYSGKVTLGSYFEIAKKYGFEFVKHKFWRIEDGRAQIFRNALIEYLEAEGFGKMYLGSDYIFVRIESNIVKEVTPVMIKDFVFEMIESTVADGTKILIRESLIKGSKTLFSEATLECMKSIEKDFVRDTKDKAMFYFYNCFVEVSAKGKKVRGYEELKGMVWEKQKVRRNYSINKEMSDFEIFLGNISRNNKNRIEALKSAIGYLLHSYKDPTKTKAILFIDEKLSESAFGRSGKGIVANSIGQLKNLLKMDGKNFRFDKSFPFQSVGADTQILFFDDVTKKFGFEKLFSIITEGIVIEKKNRNEYTIPFEDSPKIIITTNHSVSGSDDSSQARQFVIEFSDHYNLKHTPAGEFGKMFFKEWDEDDWQRFDNFMIGCAEFYLANGLVEYEHVNLIKKKLIDETAVEFEEFISELKLNQEYNKKDLFEEFKKEYEDFGQIKQNTFSKWTKVYSNLYKMKLEERKSGKERYIMLRKEEESK